MRQRILSALLALAMLLALIPAYALAAARTGSSHNFSSDWRCDADNHWHFSRTLTVTRSLTKPPTAGMRAKSSVSPPMTKPG